MIHSAVASSTITICPAALSTRGEITAGGRRLVLSVVADDVQLVRATVLSSFQNSVGVVRTSQLTVSVHPENVLQRNTELTHSPLECFE